MPRASIFVFIFLSLYIATLAVRCKIEGNPPPHDPKRWFKQHTFIRNPNYISANKRFDKMAKNLRIYELPPQAPGAIGGSSNGCEKFDE